MLNRRGHIGTLLMVIGALVLVIAALFSFVGFKDEVVKTKQELRQLSFEINYDFSITKATLESIILKSIETAKTGADFKGKFEESLKTNANLERNSDVNNNLFGKLANGDFVINTEGNGYILKVQDLQIKNELGKNEVIYHFDLAVKFDKNKVISIDKIPR